MIQYYRPTSMQRVEHIPDLRHKIKQLYPSKRIEHWTPSDPANDERTFFNYPRMALLATASYDDDGGRDDGRQIVLAARLTALEVQTWWFFVDKLPPAWQEKFHDMNIQQTFDELFLGAPSP